MLPKLYGKDKKGGVKVWYITVDGPVITTSHGKLDGKITDKVSPPKKGKNIGRSNETTPDEQAIAEANSKWQKQVDKGYAESIDSIQEGTLPPLAKKYQDNKKLLEAKVHLGSNKMDGVRCTMFFRDDDAFFQSRGGKPYPVIDEIADQLYETFWSYNHDYVIDCELYCHGMFLEDIISAVKKHNEDTSKIKAYVFDLYDPNNQDQHYQHRVDEYFDMFKYNMPNYKEAHRKIYPVETYLIPNEELLIRVHEEAVKSGFEGIVLRDPDSIFKFGQRTSEFLKYKVAESEEFQVVGFEEDKNGGGVPVCCLHGKLELARSSYKENGNSWEGLGKEHGVFRANLKGTHDRRKELLRDADELTFKWMTVEFEAWSKYNVPLKPIGIAFREMKGGEVVE